MSTDSKSSKWDQLSFDEAVEPISDEGKRVDQRDYESSGALPVIDQGESLIGGYTNDLSKSYTGPLPVVVFGDHTRRVKLINEPFAVGAQGVKLLRPRDGWSAKFFAYLLPTLPIPDRGYSRHYQFVRKLTFPRPPLDEQQRIVAEIEKQFTRLDAGVASLQSVQTKLKRYRAAVLNAAFEGDWPQTRLGDIAEVKLGKMLDKAKHVTGRKLPYLRNVNVRWGKIDTDDLLEMYFEENELDRYGLDPGDVLVCEGGEPGRAAVWTGPISGMKYQKALHRVRFNTHYNPKLLVYLLERLAQIGGLQGRFTGSTIKHFTREAFIELPIPLPPPGEQMRIVANVERRLSVVEESELLVSANLRRAARLRKSLLKNAFNGILTN